MPYKQDNNAKLIYVLARYGYCDRVIQSKFAEAHQTYIEREHINSASFKNSYSRLRKLGEEKRKEKYKENYYVFALLCSV
jgi:hypothetical protein